jgi:small subunit ribosomal protein S2
MDKKILSEMFDNLLHIGNKTNYWYPSMKAFIYGTSNGVHIIDLTKTITQLDLVKEVLRDAHTSWKKILFVATKLQSQTAFSELAGKAGHFYVTEKWVPGLLTNFKTIKKRIATYVQLEKEAANGNFDILTKKEKATKLLELEKLDKAFKWVKDMKKTPDIIFVVDAAYEDQAVKEAKSLHIPVYGICNTNSDPYTLSEAIPANTNSVKSLDYLAANLTSAFSWAVKKSPAKSVEKVATKADPTKAKTVSPEAA